MTGKQIAHRPVPTLPDLAREIHATAVDKGWWDPTKPRTFGDFIALMHSELSEALEAYRAGEAIASPVLAEELADLVIRLLDFTEGYRINLTGAILAKMEKNKQRPYRHGDKVL